jgi:hypothetical protein
LISLPVGKEVKQLLGSEICPTPKPKLRASLGTKPV